MTLESIKSQVSEILDKYLYFPVKEKGLSGGESNHRIAETRIQLIKLIGDDTKAFFEQLPLAKSELSSVYNFHFEAQILITELIDKNDSTGEYLVEIALNRSKQYEWYLRTKAINYLLKKGDPCSLKLLIPILKAAYWSRPYLEEEIVNTLLHAFVERDIKEALPTVICMQKREEVYAKRPSSFGCSNRKEIIIACAGLGDISVLSEVIELSYSDWSDIRELATQSRNKLVNIIGEAKALSLLYHVDESAGLADHYIDIIQNAGSPYIRRWALDCYLDSDLGKEDKTKKLTHFLHQNWYVASKAASHLIDDVSTDNTYLHTQIHDITVSNKSKYWIIYILLKRGVDVTGYIKQVPDTFIPLPDFISKKMRSTIIYEWALNQG